MDHVIRAAPQPPKPRPPPGSHHRQPQRPNTQLADQRAGCGARAGRPERATRGLRQPRVLPLMAARRQRQLLQHGRRGADGEGPADEDAGAAGGCVFRALVDADAGRCEGHTVPAGEEAGRVGESAAVYYAAGKLFACGLPVRAVSRLCGGGSRGCGFGDGG